MTIVVSDTSVLCYLACIGRLALLEALFGRVMVPRQVLAECLHADAPPLLRSCFDPSLPDFFEIADAARAELGLAPS